VVTYWGCGNHTYRPWKNVATHPSGHSGYSNCAGINQEKICRDNLQQCVDVQERTL
jgi:hypothetical protein